LSVNNARLSTLVLNTCITAVLAEAVWIEDFGFLADAWGCANMTLQIPNLGQPLWKHMFRLTISKNESVYWFAY